MNGVKAFVDTNVFLYAHGSDSSKQAIARDLLVALGDADKLLVSTQVIQEFYFNARRLGIAAQLLDLAVAEILEVPLVINGAKEIRSAIAIEQRYRISFWDALILAAAESGGADVVYTEDLNHGQRYGSVLVQNPFTSPQS
jgi:predicted nucleic acid-binding protein